MLTFRILADGVVLFHAGYVLFVVVGLLLILLGLVFRWRWVRNFWFRLAHLLAIGVVGAEAVLGITCPFTDLEKYLRARGGQEAYTGDFLGWCAHRLLFFEAPPWVFTTGHILFALLVLVVFVLAPPTWPWAAKRLARPAP
jgi:hypothetical protein